MGTLKASKSTTSNQEPYSSRSNCNGPSTPILNSSISRLTILGADSLIGPRLWRCTPKQRQYRVKIGCKPSLMPTSYEYSFARAAFLKSRPLTLRRGAFASGEPRRHRDVLVTYCMLTAELTPANRGAFSATEEQRAVRLHLHCHSTSC